MDKSKGIMLAVIAVLIVIAAGYLFMTPSPKATSNTPMTGVTIPDNNTPTPPAAHEATMSASVGYSASGFSPKSVAIKQGGTVTFTSTDGSPMYVASNAHPTHMQYSGTSRTEHCPDTTGTAFDQCTPGPSYTFTFTKVGTWDFHNHLSPNDQGMVVVLP